LLACTLQAREAYLAIPYVSLEYIYGGSLSARLADGPQPSRTAAEFLEVLSRAMAYAHQRGLVHRDLKPANILLSTNHTNMHELSPSRVRGNSCNSWINRVPKITDFGLAKR